MASILKTSLASALFGVAALVGATSASAAPGVKAGVITCDVDGGFGYGVGSSREISCVYAPLDGSAEVAYEGHLNRFGVDLGWKRGGTMAWAVLAPSADVSEGALSGEYVGGGAEVTLAGGVAVDALTGGLNKSIQLQPIVVQGATGINVAGGATQLSLTAAS